MSEKIVSIIYGRHCFSFAPEINMTTSRLTRFSGALLMLGALNSPLNAQTAVDASAPGPGNSPPAPDSGQSAIIAAVKDCTGVLLGDNRVVYEDAFNGAVCADVLYTIDRDSFSQDVVITGRLDPADWGFSTNAVLQIFTEFYQPPE